MMRVMGLDLSLTSTGLCVLSGAKIKLVETVVYTPDPAEMVKTEKGSKSLSVRQRIERLVAIRNHVLDRAAECKVAAVAIEGYAFSKFSSSVTGLAELGGVVRAGFLDRMTLVPITMPVTQCRQFVVGRGNVKKDAVQKWLRERGLQFDTDDEGDAYVVALTAAYALQPEMRASLDVQSLEVIDGIAGRILSRAGW